jgi:hypothetical protein
VEVSPRAEVKVTGEGGTDGEHRDRVAVRRQGEENADSGPLASNSKKRKRGGGGGAQKQEKKEGNTLIFDTMLTSTRLGVGP